MTQAHDGPRGRSGARAVAARLMLQVLADGRPLDPDDTKGPLVSLAPAERARAMRLARAGLRHLDRADATLAPFLKTPPPDPVRMVLRLALVEHFAEGAPAHAVVNEAVSTVRARPGGARLAGLVNAVLRRALATPPEAWEAHPPQRLPRWLRRRLVDAWGAPAVIGMEAAHARGAPTDLTPRTPDAAPALAATLQAEALPTASVRLARGSPGGISALPGYAQGAFWVQDAAAALPARLLDPQPGERILDLCAAPGGKTLQLAASGADVTALDISAQRLERLRINLARTGLGARIVAADALEWTPEAAFDAILLDAPCSATGTIRRHPDLPHVRRPEALDSLRPLQAALIDRALGWLVPGGRLVYSVCALLPEEGEAQIAAACDRHPGLEVCSIRPCWAEDAWRAPGGGLRLRPDHWAARGGLDGFFMALLRRRSGGGHDRDRAAG